MKPLYTIVLLIISNLFMTFAWYGHLQFQKIDWLKSTGLIGIILISWFIALFEYIFQVPANRIGFRENGGPFTLLQLKVIKEVTANHIKVIISSPYFTTSSSDVVAKQTGVKELTMATSTGAFASVKDYFDLFDYNIDNLVNVLK